jgi:hypothetical protein
MATCYNTLKALAIFLMAYVLASYVFGAGFLYVMRLLTSEMKPPLFPALESLTLFEIVIAPLRVFELLSWSFLDLVSHPVNMAIPVTFFVIFIVCALICHYLLNIYFRLLSWSYKSDSAGSMQALPAVPSVTESMRCK